MSTIGSSEAICSLYLPISGCGKSAKGLKGDQLINPTSFLVPMSTLSEKNLPKELIFNVNYLGGEMPTFMLNFSKNSDMVLAQYYNLLRLGKEGYKRIMKNILENATYLSKLLVETGIFEELNSRMFLPVLAL